jgi:bifunctional non-homologous end joining protein LigD
MAKTRTIGLESYRSKRDFTVTPEPPPPSNSPATKQMFVVQKHVAHRAGLHWDFRLERNGVLWSWAVPKGPSLDPADKRMAIHVEDHPVEYADFEGNIPTGQYGGGDVELWDRGTWEPIGDADEGMRNGELKFVLNGQRLHGRFVLVRLRQRDPKKPEAWLLIKEHDDAVRPGGGAPVSRAGTTVCSAPVEAPQRLPQPSRPGRSEWAVTSRSGSAIVHAGGRAPDRKQLVE